MENWKGLESSSSQMVTVTLVSFMKGKCTEKGLMSNKTRISMLEIGSLERGTDSVFTLMLRLAGTKELGRITKSMEKAFIC